MSSKLQRRYERGYIQIDIGAVLTYMLLCFVVEYSAQPLLDSSKTNLAASLAWRRAAHHVAHQFVMGGHDARLMPPEYVNPM